MGKVCLVAVAVVLGCDQSKAPSTSASDCRAAAESFAAAELERGDDKNSTKRRNVMAIFSQRCQDDRWTSAAVGCMAKAADRDAQQTCGYKHLTQEQQDKLDEALGQVLDDAMQMMTEFKDKMCACNDADCAKRVSDEMTQWSQHMARTQRRPVKMSEADQRRATEIGTKMGECMQRAMSRELERGERE